jgi:hypothetical protein
MWTNEKIQAKHTLLSSAKVFKMIVRAGGGGSNFVSTIFQLIQTEFINQSEK